ncbi:fimbrillin family protein [Bacteroides fragilis]|uniref:fimbrillin family protein n=1 Tax=Bacteroides fragilis TaxID=817 RepID=UPI002811BF0E|nr:fimbrillin family protein [Bacteroides fragilis]WMI93963.1 fimbrillin family protein [Bacteroides fragilis]
MKVKFFMIATVATMLAACSNDENEMNNGPVEARITAGIDGPATRAIDQSWSSGNTIGVMVTSAVNSNMTTLYRNVKYMVGGAGTNGTFTAATGKGIFFQDASETVTFAAYSPYQTSANAATLPGTNGTVTGVNTKTQTDQATQETFDYLFAGGATASKGAPTVEFKDSYNFKHQMARLILVLKTSETDGFTAGQVFNGTYKLGGLKHDGTFNVTNGTATATGGEVSDWNITNNYKEDGNPANTRTYTMILYPQNTGGALTFIAEIAGQTYTNTTSIQPALAAGTSYTYTITMKKTGLTVSGCTISPWNPGAGGSGDATM